MDTTAYNPEANGLVERLHRQLKSAIMCHETEAWVDMLPVILLGFRAIYKEDLGATSSELVFGETIRLPGEFLQPSHKFSSNPMTAVTELRRYFADLAPQPTSRHCTRSIFCFKDLLSCSHVFIRRDYVRRSLIPPYEGPFKVISRSDKYYVVQIKGKDVSVSIDRLKPFYEPSADPTNPKSDEGMSNSNRNNNPVPNERKSNSTKKIEVLPNVERRTRYGRKVHFPDRFGH